MNSPQYTINSAFKPQGWQAPWRTPSQTELRPWVKEQPPRGRYGSMYEYSDARFIQERTPVLYLAFDGVLHHEDVTFRGMAPVMKAPGEQLFAHCDALIELLKPLPDLLIVLSTSWAARLGFASAAMRLPRGLRLRTFACTRPASMGIRSFLEMSCGEQIARDIVRRGRRPFFIIDRDARDFLPEHAQYLVHTDCKDGLSSDRAALGVRHQVERICELTRSPS